MWTTVPTVKVFLPLSRSFDCFTYKIGTTWSRSSSSSFVTTKTESQTKQPHKFWLMRLHEHIVNRAKEVQWNKHFGWINEKWNESGTAAAATTTTTLHYHGIVLCILAFSISACLSNCVCVCVCAYNLVASKSKAWTQKRNRMMHGKRRREKDVVWKFYSF